MCHNVYRKPEFVSLHHQLMRSGHKIEIVDATELLGDLATKEIPCTSTIYGPMINILGVWPHEITECSFVGDFNFSVDCSNLVDGSHVGTEASMHAQDFAFHQGSQGQTIEDFHEQSPWTAISILSEKFIIKAINLGTLAGLMITSE